jgi:transcription antitermination protein NusB
MGNRHRAREYALQVLFEMDFNDADRALLIRHFWDGLHVPREVIDFAMERVNGVLRHRRDLDALITTFSENWKLDRMTAVDRNVLRMAVFEILHCADVPRNVVINEAVEIGKRFGTEESGAFINGILDQIAHREAGRVAGSQ